MVSAIFVTPYPPGFPVLVPGQAFSKDILDFMDALDTREIHGFDPSLGYRVFTQAALDGALTDREALGETGDGHPDSRRGAGGRRRQPAGAQPAVAQPAGAQSAKRPGKPTAAK